MGEDNCGAVRQIHGSCHCGNIRFVFNRPDSGGPIAVRACGCSFCAKHRGVWTSHPRGPVTLALGDPARVQRYRFGSETADFYICSNCGVAPVVASEIDGAHFAVINVNCFDDVARDELEEAATDFDGEATADRLARRQRNWSPLEMAD